MMQFCEFVSNARIFLLILIKIDYQGEFLIMEFV